MYYHIWYSKVVHCNKITGIYYFTPSASYTPLILKITWIQANILFFPFSPPPTLSSPFFPFPAFLSFSFIFLLSSLLRSFLLFFDLLSCSFHFPEYYQRFFNSFLPLSPFLSFSNFLSLLPFSSIFFSFSIFLHFLFAPLTNLSVNSPLSSLSRIVITQESSIFIIFIPTKLLHENNSKCYSW